MEEVERQISLRAIDLADRGLGLDTGVNYNIRVYARNMIGESNASNRVSFTLAGESSTIP